MIRIGPAGTGGSSLGGINRRKELGLDAAEIEFVRGVRMSNELAKQLGEENRKLGLVLSVHAPYYINLASEDSEKREASKKRILDSCERGHHMKARYIVFHPAFYGKLSPEECYQTVKNAVLEMQDMIKQNEWDVVLCPETTGKRSQFGSIEELIRLSKETGCGICIDFAHLEARQGRECDYEEVIRMIKDIQHKTAHFSGIEYTDKGERRHVMTDMDKAKKLVSSMQKHDLDITIINESPDPINDALLMKKLL